MLLWVWVLSIASARSSSSPATATASSFPGRPRPDAARRVLRRADAVRARRAPLHPALTRAGRRRGPEPAAPAPGDDDPPADALLGLRRLRGAVRVRVRRRSSTRPARHGLAPHHAALDAVRLDLPLGRHPARRPLGLRGARLGRLLGLGPGRERLVHAVAAPPPTCTR